MWPHTSGRVKPSLLRLRKFNIVSQNIMVPTLVMVPAEISPSRSDAAAVEDEGQNYCYSN